MNINPIGSSPGQMRSKLSVDCQLIRISYFGAVRAESVQNAVAVVDSSRKIQHVREHIVLERYLKVFPTIMGYIQEQSIV